MCPTTLVGRAIDTEALPTVADCLRLPTLRGCELVCGATAATERRVDWVAVIERPVEDFVTRGELVLTTGLGCSAEQLVELAAEVVDSGASALGVAIGSGAPHRALPRRLVALAETHSFPLMTLPWELRFAEVSRAVVAEILDAASPRQGTGQLASAFTDDLLAGRGPDGIARTLEGMLDRPVIVLDARLGLLARGPRGASELEHVPPAGLGGRAIEALTEEALAAEGRVADLDQLGLSAALVGVAVADGRTAGYVLALVSSNRRPRATEVDAIEQASTALSIEILRRQSAAEAEARAHGDFFWELASRALADPHAIAERARLLGYDPNRRYLLAVGQAPKSSESLIKRVAQEGRRLAAAEGIGLFARHNQLLLVAPDSAPAHLRPKRLTRKLNQAEAVLSWGVAEGSYDMFAIGNGVDRARRALEVGLAIKGVGSVADSRDLGALMLLAGVADDPTARRLADESLAPLERYDQRKAGNLVSSLRVYLQENGNTSAAARRLHLNRHSLRYRLEKIEELTDRDLEDHRERLLLELSLAIREIAIARERH